MAWDAGERLLAFRRALIRVALIIWASLMPFGNFDQREP